jgi:hypothetical protein
MLLTYSSPTSAFMLSNREMWALGLDDGDRQKEMILLLV